MLQSEFVETVLKTKFSEFNMRVYRDVIGKETIVLWTKDLDITEPVLVRVHSECITGDMLGSLHCDCGKQLNKSLHIISEQNGVFIYLRQEGRGIGLFEKIKTYQLQSQGFDTVEANVLLGHKPDQRTYEMVKIILKDLNITRIKLLTNNPIKVSEIAKYGIEVVERIPLISKANKYNKKYLETKRNKFQHFLEKTNQHYFYQFQVDNYQQVISIKEFFKNFKKDPFLKLCVGITIKVETFKSESEKTRVDAILNACENNPDLIPKIHYSFLNSKNYLNDISEIKRIWPQVERIQLNDMHSIELSFLKKVYELFTPEIPLSDNNFDIIKNAQFRSLVKKNKTFILLDNSKGRGISENKDSYIKKIDALLALGLNNIVLCGGFGPDSLHTYFDLRRYYRINFSIDAESKLKTNGKIDLEKIKTYLSQLMRFDDPKEEGIEQTRRFLDEYRRNNWDSLIIEGFEFLIHPKVFHAGHFPSSGWFASELCKLLKYDTNFCEVGCGSGLISCLVSKALPSLKITATDINPFASENTVLNAKRLGLSEKIKVVNGDVLDSIDPHQKFDTIFWALPFGYLDPGTEIDLEESQVFDPGYRAIRKFLKTGIKYLTPNGRLLIGFSSDLGHPDLLAAIANEFSISLTKICEKIMKEDVEVKFEILEGKINNL